MCLGICPPHTFPYLVLFVNLYGQYFVEPHLSHEDGTQHPVILPSDYLLALANHNKLDNLFVHPSLLQTFWRNFLETWLYMRENHGYIVALYIMNIYSHGFIYHEHSMNTVIFTKECLL